jgi:hypothetical protein
VQTVFQQRYGDRFVFSPKGRAIARRDASYAVLKADAADTMMLEARRGSDFYSPRDANGICTQLSRIPKLIHRRTRGEMASTR